VSEEVPRHQRVRRALAAHHWRYRERLRLPAPRNTRFDGDESVLVQLVQRTEYRLRTEGDFVDYLAFCDLADILGDRRRAGRAP
jgi:hypothetical protein